MHKQKCRKALGLASVDPLPSFQRYHICSDTRTRLTGAVLETPQVTPVGVKIGPGVQRGIFVGRYGSENSDWSRYPSPHGRTMRPRAARAPDAELAPDSELPRRSPFRAASARLH
jgi:hypothetical protein